MGAHSCDLYSEPTDSDGDSPDDDQEDTDAVPDADAATVNATAATANETDNCEVCLVAQREPRLALVPCVHMRFANHVFVTLKVQEVGVLSVVQTSLWFFAFINI